MSYPVKLALTGVVVDVPSLSYTRGGAPRTAFDVLVRGVTTHRRHHVVTFGTVAKFCDDFVRPGQRVHVEGTSMPRGRFPSELRGRFNEPEAVILAQSVREVQRKARPSVAPSPSLAATATPPAAEIPAAAPLAFAR
jgi:hypothetical protein